MRKMFGLILLLSCTAFAVQKEIVIASEYPGGNLAKMIEGFTKATGIKVSFVTQGKAALVDFIPVADADLVITSVGDELELAKRAGQLRKMTAKVETDVIPTRFRDPDGYWIGYSYRVRSIFFNNTVNSEEVPTYEQLADPKWAGRLCTRTMDHKYNHAFVAWYLATHGEAETKKWLAGIKANAVKPIEGGDPRQAQKVSEGKCDISITNSYYMVELLENAKTRANAATNLSTKLPGQDANGAYALVNSIAVLKQAKHPKEANALIEFLEGYMAQRWLADVLTVYPVRSDVQPRGFLKGYGKTAFVEVPKIDQTPISKAVDCVERARVLIQEAGYEK